MSVFAYGRVSTNQQTAENQRLEIINAGFQIDYWFADEGVSGKVCAKQRPQFSLMLDKIRDGETLIVSKLDRLGRDSIDVLQTVQSLADRNIKAIVLQLGNTDLSSPTGKLLLTMLVAVASMERDLLIERTHAGLMRARAEGKRLGRPSKTSPEQKAEIVLRRHSSESVASLAREYGVSRATVISIIENSTVKTFYGQREQFKTSRKTEGLGAATRF